MVSIPINKLCFCRLVETLTHTLAISCQSTKASASVCAASVAAFRVGPVRIVVAWGQGNLQIQNIRKGLERGKYNRSLSNHANRG